MSDQSGVKEFLVISRGQWNADASKADIQAAIDQFYQWLDGMIDQGKMKTGKRLGGTGRTVRRDGVVTDGPFGETKEVVGGYYYILAKDLDEAAAIIAQNPVIKFGLFFELRPTDETACSVDVPTVEMTPR